MTHAHVVGRRWYVVRTKARQEQRAESNLGASGFETLAPRLHEVRCGHWSSAPLFPGYLFARFDAMNDLAKVRYVRGVSGVVGLGEYATAIDGRVIEQIRRRVGDDGFVKVEEPMPGDHVRIVAGPLRLLDGIFDRRLSGRDRVIILLKSVGSTSRVQLPSAFVRKAGDESAA